MWSRIESPSHLATKVLVAVCEGKVHLIFSLATKGTHIAPLENNDIHVHLHTLPVISYPCHFARCCSFGTVLIFSSSGRRPEELYCGGPLRPPSVCLSVCLSENIFIDGPKYFSVLAQFDSEMNILTKF